MRDIHVLVARWTGRPGTLVHVRDGANSVYRFEVDGEPRILRVTADCHRSRGQLEAEIDFIQFVTPRRVQAARPLPSRRDALVETITGDDGDAWHGVVFEALPGRHFEFFSSDVDRPLFHAWGASMGALHTASREFVPQAARRRPRWDEQDSTRCDTSGLPATEDAARREHARVHEWLATCPSTSANSGLIHGDFERTNFLLAESSLRVFDFDDACYHWYVADLAHALWAFRNAPVADRRRYLTWFVEGYRDCGALDDDLEERLSWFVRLRSLSLFTQRLIAATAANEQWLRRMRGELEVPFRW